PGFSLVPGAGQRAVVFGVAELFELVHDRAHLAGAGAAGNDEEVGHGTESAHVEHRHVMTSGIGGQTRRLDRKCFCSFSSIRSLYLFFLFHRSRSDVAPPVLFVRTNTMPATEFGSVNY